MDSDLELGIAAAALAVTDPAAPDRVQQPPPAAALPLAGERRPAARLMWFGAATLGQCDLLLRGGRHVEVDLPQDFQHALLVCLRPNAPSCPCGPVAGGAACPPLDVRGGAELLGLIAGIKGLEMWRQIQPVVVACHAAVRIVSPARVLLGPDIAED
jgi:hypothetical protein